MHRLFPLPGPQCRPGPRRTPAISRRLPSLVALAAAFATATAGLAQDNSNADESPALTFDEPESVSNWSFSNGPEWPGARGSLKWDEKAGRDGSGGLVLKYDFSGGGNYVAALVDLPEQPEVKAVRLWVHKPAANLMIIRAVDAKGEVFQKNLRYHYPGWQELEVSLGDWIFSWGGDGTFQWPARALHILVENDGGTREGQIVIDDVRWVYRPTAKSAGVARTTYVESDFSGESGPWNTSGPQGCRFRAPAWTYRFTPQRDRVSLTRDRSVLGKPQALKLTLESDGSGHEVVARFGSHFQLFERSLGTLDKAGRVTLEVPMGDMKSWKHFGGEDDGIVRYPLRLTELALVKKGQRDSGTLKLDELAFETQYDPRTESVTVVPSIAGHDEDTVRFNVELRSLADRPLEGALRWELHSADKRLQDGTRPVTLTGNRTAVTIEGHWTGASVAEGRFQFAGDGVQSVEASTTVARVPAGEPDLSLDPDSRMGVGMYLYRFHGRPDGKEWMERMCRLAAQAGVKWTREEFHWNWMEPKPGEWDFSFFDQLVDTATAHGISIYALCCYYTEWNQPPVTDEFIDHYCDYLRTLVKRYGDRIKHWEIWNEPNIFFWPGTPEQYATLLRRAYETIKAVDPDAQVLGCSTAGIDVKFIRQVVDRDTPFDQLTVHPYRGSLDAKKLVGELKSVQELVGGRNVWITEMGWPSNIGGLTERQQAQYVARTYVAALASEAVRSVSWYDFREDGDDPFYNEHHFGLIRNDLEPKIGYRALATIGRLIGDAEIVGPLELGDDLVGFLFRAGDRHVAAVWTTGETRITRFRTLGKNVRFVNLVGDPANVADKAPFTLVKLEPLTPVYIVADSRPEITVAGPAVQAQVEPAGVHPGEPVQVTINAAAGVTVDFPAPVGWAHAEPTDGATSRASESRPNGRFPLAFTYTLRVPDNARPGSHTLMPTVEIGDAMYTLPIEVNVVPPLVRG